MVEDLENRATQAEIVTNQFERYIENGQVEEAYDLFNLDRSIVGLLTLDQIGFYYCELKMHSVEWAEKFLKTAQSRLLECRENAKIYECL